MKVKDILLLTATILNRKDLVSFYNLDVSDDYLKSQEDSDILLSSYNILIEEIATETLKLNYLEKLTVNDGVLSYANFKYNPIQIISVKNDKMQDVNYKILPTEIITDESEVYCEYSYVPALKGLEDDCEIVGAFIPKTTLAYGIASEFCLIKGMFEEASVWHQKYVNGLTKLVKPKKCKKLNVRKWL